MRVDSFMKFFSFQVFALLGWIETAPITLEITVCLA
jgi:hypothetical protein